MIFGMGLPMAHFIVGKIYEWQPQDFLHRKFFCYCGGREQIWSINTKTIALIPNDIILVLENYRGAYQTTIDIKALTGKGEVVWIRIGNAEISLKDFRLVA